MNEGETRRELLRSLGAAGIGLAAGPALADREMASTARVTTCANGGVQVSDIFTRIARLEDFVGADACMLASSTVEGPYFICADTQNARAIAEGLDGTPMTIAIRVSDQNCRPIPSAIVDVWQCDARGNYSGHSVDPDTGVMPGPGRREPDAPTRFLRGVLATDAEGVAEFDAIYPGFYAGRAIHTHYKVHVGDRAFLTAQALYPEEWNSKILEDPLYHEDRTTPRVSNANDMFRSSSGLFTVTERDGRLLATINLSVKV